MLYQVATAASHPRDIASPIRSILRRQRNVEVLLADVTRVDVDRRTGPPGRRYRRSTTTIWSSRPAPAIRYFGHDEWEALAPGLKSLEDALEIRRRVLLAFEAAEREPDPCNAGATC